MTKWCTRKRPDLYLDIKTVGKLQFRFWFCKTQFKTGALIFFYMEPSRILIFHFIIFRIKIPFTGSSIFGDNKGTGKGPEFIGGYTKSIRSPVKWVTDCDISFKLLKF